MRHNKAINHLGRKSGHRKALLANMAASLILNKRIQTTVAKAKETFAAIAQSTQEAINLLKLGIK